MMLIKAEQRNSRQSPRKVRLVMNAVKGMSIPMAIDQLSIMEKKASKVVMQVMNQALANAKNNLSLNVEDLEIHEMLANTGATYRRFRAVSRGRGHSIQKKTTHVRIVLKTKQVIDATSSKKQTDKVEGSKVKKGNKQKAVVAKTEQKVEKKKTTKKVESKKVLADKKPVKGVMKTANNAKRAVKKINNY